MSLIEQMAFVQVSDSSLEAAGVEYENEIYLRGFDINEIKAKATSHEGQEQWGIYVPKADGNASSGSIRVRKTIDMEGGSIFELATKTEMGEKGKFETEIPSIEEMFVQFQMLADQGLVKIRYNIPGQLDDGTTFVYQVDCFWNKDGNLVPWCKIDAEFTNPVTLNPEEIPFGREEIIIVTPESKTENANGLKEKIAGLYEEFFRSKNIHV